MTGRRLLLAGSVGPERIAARPDAHHARWFEPLHVREERAARARIAGQVEAGADIVVAPTWLTHRRALLPLGETRQARAWTAAAVEIARQGVEAGLERRGAALADAPPDDTRRGRPTPLVAAVLPALDDAPEPDSGQLLPREAASERDYRDQAGLLADAEPDLLLVTGQRTAEEARLAMREACDVGLPAWAALEPDVVGQDPGRWFEWAQDMDLARLLVPAASASAEVAAGASMAWGVAGGRADDVAGWLTAGAGAVALLDGASPAALEPVRAAIDEHERAEIAATRAATQRWRDHVATAAAMAPGGAAAWLGDRPTDPLPVGFEWLIIGVDEIGRLPADRFRLIVLAADPSAVPDVGRSVERGGIVAVAGILERGGTDLRLVTRADDDEPRLTIYRRDA